MVFQWMPIWVWPSGNRRRLLFDQTKHYLQACITQAMGKLGDGPTPDKQVLMSSFDSSFHIRLPRVYEDSRILLYPPRYRYMAGIYSFDTSRVGKRFLVPLLILCTDAMHPAIYTIIPVGPWTKLHYMAKHKVLEDTWVTDTTSGGFKWDFLSNFLVGPQPPQLIASIKWNAINNFTFFMASGQPTPTSQLGVHVADWLLTAYPFDSNYRHVYI